MTGIVSVSVRGEEGAALDTGSCRTTVVISCLERPRTKHNRYEGLFRACVCPAPCPESNRNTRHHKRRLFNRGHEMLLAGRLFNVPSMPGCCFIGSRSPCAAGASDSNQSIPSPHRTAIFQPHGKVRARPGPSGEALCMAAPCKWHVVNDATRSLRV